MRVVVSRRGRFAMRRRRFRRFERERGFRGRRHATRDAFIVREHRSKRWRRGAGVDARARAESVGRVWDGVDDARVVGIRRAAIGDGFERRRVDVCVDVARRGRRARERASTGEDAHRLSDAATRVRRRASGDASHVVASFERGALPRVRVRRWRRGTGRRRRRRRRRCEIRCDEPARRARGGSQSARRGSGCERDARRAHVSAGSRILQRWSVRDATRERHVIGRGRGGVLATRDARRRVRVHVRYGSQGVRARNVFAAVDV